MRTGLSSCSEASGGVAASSGFLDALLPVVAAGFLGLLALGGTAFISTFSLNSSIYMISLKYQQIQVQVSDLQNMYSSYLDIRHTYDTYYKAKMNTKFLDLSHLCFINPLQVSSHWTIPHDFPHCSKRLSAGIPHLWCGVSQLL